MYLRFCPFMGKYGSEKTCFLSYFTQWNYLQFWLDMKIDPLKSDSHLPKKVFYFFQWKPFRNYEKCLLFYLKRFFCSQDITVFVLTFWPSRKNGFIRKIRLISKFITSQPGQETITIHKLSNNSRSKGNQAMKFGQVT